jgi:PhnB protein
MPVKPIPDGYHTLTPLIAVRGVPRLIEFLKVAFGATEIMRFDLPDGSVMHAEVKIGDSSIMMGEMMDDSPPAHAALYFYVPEVDVVYRAAMDAGAESLTEPSDQFWGDRTASIKDPTGNTWWIATHVEDVSPEEIKKRTEAFK